MHTFWKKERKNEQAQQLPSLHGRSGTPNSLKEKKKKNEPIVSLHEKSDKPNSGKRKNAWPFMEDQSHLTLGKKKKNEPSTMG